MARPGTVVFAELAELAIRLGVAPINNLAGCWEHQIDDQWWVAVNAHADPVKCSKGVEVPMGHAYFEFNGWPAGMVNPFDGWLAAGGAANEDALIDALRRAGT